jgi:hypothetical protein
MEDGPADNDEEVEDGLKADESLVAPLIERLLQVEDKDDEEERRALCEDQDGLKRFLVARQNHFDKALTMAANTTQWRAKVKPQCLTVADFPIANAQGTWRFAGYAKNGWPIILVRARLWDPAKYSLDEYVKMVAFYLDTNVKRMNPEDNASKNFLIFDMQGLSYLKTDMSKLRQLAKLTSEYYPERLGFAVVLHADWVFQATWKIMRGWVDARTAAKARVFSTDFFPFLQEHIGAENLSEDLGGTRTDWPLLDADMKFSWDEVA